MKAKLFLIPVLSCSLLLNACFLEGDEWKEKYGTPELLLENAYDKACVYLYEDQKQFYDDNNLIKEAIIAVEPFEKASSFKIPKDVRYFTFEAKWQPATSGPNYEHLNIWENGYVRIHHKASLGAHKYEYFSLNEEKAAALVDYVFTLIEANK